MNRQELLQTAKPILFNTEMVQAILDGRKTVTRRVIKPKYREDEGGFKVCTVVSTGERYGEKMDWDEGSFDEARYIKPPYHSGDIIYVRETWNYGYFESSDAYLDNSRWFEEMPFKHRDKGGFMHEISDFIYKADFTVNELYEYGMEDEHGNLKPMPWKPSIHMPKEAARIFLKVTDVRVEQLRDIKLQDILNEGVKLSLNGTVETGREGATKPFVSLWNNTVPKAKLDEYGWDANPWVWVIEFERLADGEMIEAAEENGG